MIEIWYLSPGWISLCITGIISFSLLITSCESLSRRAVFASATMLLGGMSPLLAVPGIAGMIALRHSSSISSWKGLWEKWKTGNLYTSVFMLVILAALHKFTAINIHPLAYFVVMVNILFAGFISIKYLNKKEQRRKESLDPQRFASKTQREEILRKYKYRCVACGVLDGEPGVTLQMDHIIPHSKGGRTTLDNLQPLCGPCNLKKGNKKR